MAHEINEQCKQNFDRLHKTVEDVSTGQLQNTIDIQQKFGEMRSLREREDNHGMKVAKAMEDISEIKERMEGINGRINNIETKIDLMVERVKNWILIGILSGAVALSGSIIGSLVYLGGVTKQVDIDSRRIDVLEARK